MIDIITDEKLLCKDIRTKIYKAKNLKVVINKLKSRRVKLKESKVNVKFRNDPN